MLPYGCEVAILELCVYIPWYQTVQKCKIVLIVSESNFEDRV